MENSYESKTKHVLDNLADNYDIFLDQARIKLNKHSRLCSQDAYKELGADVIFSIVQKLDSSSNIDFYFSMINEDKLKLYTLKAISTNTSFYSAPFLRQKIQDNNKLLYIDNIVNEDEDFKERENKENIQDLLVSNVKQYLELPKAKELFGEDWHYYTNLFKEYINTESSYSSLSKKYSIPKSSIAFHIRYVKSILRTELLALTFDSSILIVN
jgi:hypothetical protein